jgi:hypothetical protein
MKGSKRLKELRNLWIVLALLGANGLAWMSALSIEDLREVEPRLHPDVAAMRERLLSGEASGERFFLRIDDQMASEGVAWFLNRHPNIPFSHPQVEFDAEGITGRGLVHMVGLRTQLYGRAAITLQDGVPVVRILELGIAGAAVPGFIRDAVQGEVEAQFDFANNPLPFELTRLELVEGMMVVEGRYR